MKRRYCRVIVGALLLIIAAFGTRATMARDGGLYPSEPIPGYPGADGKQNAVWGWPEVLPYPGSVEHVRDMHQKYTPPVPLFDADSLVKNFIAAQIPRVSLSRFEEFSEPVYYLPMYAQEKATGQLRPAVKVVRWSVNSPPFRLALGRLQTGYYAVRVIAAIETKDVAPSPKPLIMRFRVNDGKNGALSTSTRRLRAVDNFYSVAEWYFRAHDDREFQVELSLVEGTEVELLVHNIDLHDVLAHLPRKQAKRGPSLFTLEERGADRAEFAAKATAQEYAEAFRRTHGAAPPTRPYRPAPLPPEARAKLDDELWNGLPAMNAQYNNYYGKMNNATAEEIKSARAKGMADQGWGVFFPETQDYWTPLADQMTSARNNFLNKITPTDGGYPASWGVLRYHFAADREAARDSAFVLCRVACSLPTWDMQHSIQNVVCRPDQCFDREQTLRRRVSRAWCYPALKLVEVYDMLFDFIQGNEELAQAVGRFVPDIKTSGDLLRFLDTNILQYTADLILRYRIYSDEETSDMMVTAATVQGDREVTRPWMDWLFSRTWVYPMPLSGLQDYLNAATTRDGTTYIGSWFYTAGGGVGKDMAIKLDRYVKAGGDPRYALADFRVYPKILTSCYWPLEGRVAGLYAMQIGDVNGPTVSYGHWFESAEAGIRLGWRWTKDPQFAHCLRYAFGRKGESDEDWKKVEEVGGAVRNPWFANRSRVLSDWAGVLESGTEQDDFRFRRATTVRVGNGFGHAHNDTLDMNLFAHGCVMAADGGQRPGYGHPECFLTFTHNLVEVDGDGGLRGKGNWIGHGWIRTLADAPGARFLLAESVPPENHPEVKLFRRHVALIDVDEGKPSATPIGAEDMVPDRKLPGDIITPSSYVFDVFRVSGGKTHTYCFHGTQNDELNHNARNVKPVPVPEAGKEDFEASYLRKFDIMPERHWAGDGVEHFEATWRLNRENMPFTFQDKTFSTGAAEPANLGRNYDPAAPRKFTKLHVFGETAARILGATYFNAPYTSTSGGRFDCIFVQNRGDQERESAFVALVEPYAGDPFIADARLLPIPDNEKDARCAVALEVRVAERAEVNRAGRTDVCFADGRPEKVRQVGDAVMSGQFACLSRDGAGLRQATLVGGALLSAPEVSIALSKVGYEARIGQVDYLDRVATLDRPMPSLLLDGASFEVGNDLHRTSLEVSDVEGNKMRFRKGVEIVTTRVVSVDAEKQIVRGRLAVPILGLQGGLTATNEDRSKCFQCEFLGGTNQDGFEYRMTVPPSSAALPKVSKDVFPEGSALRVFEFGPGDAVSVTAFASVRRFGENVYEVRANAPVTMGLPVPADKAAVAVEVSADRVAWTALKTPETKEGKVFVPLTEAMLGGGRAYLRLK